jgi:SlyX protein
MTVNDLPLDWARQTTRAVEDLQSRIVFQEDTLQKLDEVLIQQSRLIEKLELKIAHLESKIEAFRDNSAEQRSPEDERPPHY